VVWGFPVNGNYDICSKRIVGMASDSRREMRPSPVLFGQSDALRSEQEGGGAARQT